MNVTQRDAANAKIWRNQNTIDLLTYFPIWYVLGGERLEKVEF